MTDVRIARRGTGQRLRGVRIDGRIGSAPATRLVTGAAVSRALGLPSPGFIVVTR